MSDSATLHGTVTRSQYEELPGINWSVLKLCIDHPAKSIHQLSNPKEPTPRLVLGQAIHAATLEGMEAYRKQFAVSPRIDRRTIKGKEEAASFKTRSAGKHVISDDDDRTVKRVRESVLDHPAASDLLSLSQGVSEAAITWEIMDGLFGKGIIDMLTPENYPLVDLKTCRDASPSGFAKAIANYLYAGQACYYRRGVASLEGRPPRDFVIIAVEVEPPYCVGVYRLNADAIDSGERMVDLCLDRWLAATRGRTGFKPHHTDYIEDLGIPPWAMQNEAANVVA